MVGWVIREGAGRVESQLQWGSGNALQCNFDCGKHLQIWITWASWWRDQPSIMRTYGAFWTRQSMIDHHIVVKAIYFSLMAFLCILVMRPMIASVSYHYSRKYTWWNIKYEVILWKNVWLPNIIVEMKFVLNHVFYEQGKETLYVINETKLMLID